MPPGILWARLPLPMALDHVNVYALDEGDSWTVIDTGLDWKKGRAYLGQALLDGPLAGQAGWARFCHPSSPGSCRIGRVGFRAAHGAELVTTRTAWLMARMLVLDAQAVPPEETMAFWRGLRAWTRASWPSGRQGDPSTLPIAWRRCRSGYTRIKEGDRVIAWAVATGLCRIGQWSCARACDAMG